MTSLAFYFGPINLLLIGLSAAATLVSLLSLLLLFFNQRKVKYLQQKLLRLERDVRIINGSTVSMGQHLLAFEKHIKQAPDTQASKVSAKAPSEPDHQSPLSLTTTVNTSDTLEKIVTDSGTSQTDSMYNEARDALAQGMNIKEVAKQCGLSYAEVSLLKALGGSSSILSH